MQPLIEEGYSFVLLAGAASEAAPPCPSDWPECGDLNSGSAVEQAQKMAEAMTTVLGRQCQGVVQLFGRLATVGPGDRPFQLRAALPDALRSCQCSGVNMSRLEWLAPELVGLRETRAVGVPYETGQTGTVGEWMTR